MAILILRPNGAGSECSIPDEIGAACPNHWQNVDEAICDETTTTVQDWGAAPQPYRRDLYAIESRTTETGTINSVKVVVCAHEGVPSYHRFYRPVLKSNGVVTDGTEVDHDTGNVYSNFSQTWVLNPADSEAWEWTDIDAMEIGIGVQKKNDGSPRASQVYVEVDFELVAEGRSQGHIIG